MPDPRHAIDDLVAWLRVVLDEDERAAKRASESSPNWQYDGTNPRGPRVVVGRDTDDIWTRNINSAVWECDDELDGCIELADTWAAEAEHMARHDPAAVLADIAAKRAVLELHAIVWRDITWLEREDDQLAEAIDELPVCGLCVPRHSSFQSRDAVPEGPCRTIRLLATGYTERPGYDPEWGPE